MMKSKKPVPEGTKGPMTVIKPRRPGLGFEKLGKKIVPRIKRVRKTVPENEN